MQIRKSNAMFESGRVRPSSLSPGSVENRGWWWKGIHDELISFMSTPHLVHQLTKRIVHFASRSLKRSPSSETDSSSMSPELGSRRASNRKAKLRTEEEIIQHNRLAFLSDNDSHEENKVLQNASPCGMKRRRRKSPLRAIQHIIENSFEKSSCTAVQPKAGSAANSFEAYGYSLQECSVVLTNFGQQAFTIVETDEYVDSRQAQDESNSSREKTDRSDSSKNNESAATGFNGNVSSRRLQLQNCKQSTRLSSGQQKPRRPRPQPRDPKRLRTMIKREPDSSDDEGFGAFNKLFAKRQNRDPLESDTEAFWAERRRHRKAIDYEREAWELLGLEADFSTPISKNPSPVESFETIPSGGSQRRQVRSSSSISTPKNGHGRRSNNGRRRSPTQLKCSRRDTIARSAQNTPKWQQAKEVAVKVSRSGRLIKPPINESYV